MMSPKATQTARQATQTARQATQTARQNYPIIGFVVWWSISEMELTQAALEKAVKASIGEAFMRDVPGKKRALRTALNAVEESGLIRRIRDDKEVIAYTLHEEIINKKDIDLDLKKEQVIVYDKATDKLDIRLAFKRDEIRSLFEKYQTVFTESDVRAITLQYVKANGGVTMRESGGIYFIPQTATRDQLKAFINAVNGSFYSLGVPDEDTDKAVMHELVKDELDRDLQLAAEDLKQLLSKDGDRSKADSFETRLERFKTLRAKTELYKDLLKNDVEGLTKTISDLNDEVTKALMGEIKESPQSKQFPYKSRVTYNGRAKDKYGDTGTVVGYGSCNNHNAKILFDKTDQVRMVAIEFLKIIAN
mgnify:CR=1 FL=1